MKDANSAARSERERYREVATEIRALFRMLKHPEAVEELRLLAARYEWLAEYPEAGLGTLKHRPFQYRRQAG